MNKVYRSKSLAIYGRPKKNSLFKEYLINLDDLEKYVKFCKESNVKVLEVYHIGNDYDGIDYYGFRPKENE